MRLNWSGTPEELQARLAQLPEVFAGRAPDSGGAVQSVVLAMGLALLARVKQNFATCSGGGSNELGDDWPPLAGSTLALRRIVATPASVKRMAAKYSTLSASQKAQVDIHAKRIGEALYSDEGKKRAVRILDKKKRAGAISKEEYAKKIKLITGMTKADIKRRSLAAMTGSFAQILHVTGRLLNSLSPEFQGNADQILDIRPGSLTVGSNVLTDSGIPLLSLHTSPAPRKMKRDGSGPILPRRKVIPEGIADLPASWLEDMIAAAKSVMATRQFWLAYLGHQAS